MEECPICLEPCERDFIVTECCGNHFHTPCHTECMKVNRSCPTCRHVVIEVEHHLVQVRSSPGLFRNMLKFILILAGIGTFCGVVTYYIFDSYIKKI